MSKHTPEPWQSRMTGKPELRNVTWLVEQAKGDRLVSECMFADVDNEANAERIAACVNATAGIPTEALEAGVIAELVAKVDALFASLRTGMGVIHNKGVESGAFLGQADQTAAAFRDLKAVLAKVKGGGK